MKGNDEIVNEQEIAGLDWSRRENTKLQGRTLLLARAIWLVVAAITVALEAISIPPYYILSLTPCRGENCSNIQPAFDQVQSLQAAGVSLDLFAALQVALPCLATLVYIGVALVIFWRKSDDRMALFGSLTLVLFSGSATSTVQSLVVTPSALALPASILNVAGQVCFGLFFSLFPNGRFVPGWTRWLNLVWFAAWIAMLFPATELVGRVLAEGPLFVVFVGALIVAQVYRYRRVSNARERQQTKWVVFGFVAGMTGFVAVLAFVALFIPPSLRTDWIGEVVDSIVVYSLIATIPISIAIAILRSRLYDIDVIINRTLVYGSLTLSLLLVYFGLVVALGGLLRTLAGQEHSDLVIVASTLAMAAVFNPLRRRIQSAIDRRFYRRKYDAAKTLAAFSEALRDEVDLNSLTGRLVKVVEETMQPEHISLWLSSDRMAAKEKAL